MEKNLNHDEKNDIELMKEAMQRTDTYDEMARWLTTVWQRKYGSEFRGNVSLTYDLADETFTLRCGDNIKFFEESELDLIPKQLKFFRKQ